MLRAQISFFLPLAAAAVMLAWTAGTARPWLYTSIAVLSIALSAALLCGAIAVLTPGDGLLHASALVVAYVMPVAFLAAVLWLVRGRVSLASRIGSAVLLSAALSWVAPMFLLVGTCIAQGNCL
jgi:hypothetical protein